MERVKELTPNQIIAEWTEEVKDNVWETSCKPVFRKMIRGVLERLLDEELDEHTQARRYERNEGRLDYRNGGYRRTVVTEFGVVEVDKPRGRKINCKSRIIPNYQRRHKAVDDTILEMFIAGVSTRRVETVVKPLFGRVSAQTVSNIAKRLDKEAEKYHKKKLIDEYRYLILDGIHVKVQGALKAVDKVVLVAYGITVFGKKEVIDFGIYDSESARVCEGFLNRLYRRGLTGENLKLIIIDGSKGLHSAAEYVYGGTEIQRCWAHKMRNVENKLPKRYKEECMAEAKKIYLASSRREAVRIFKEWKKKWEGRVFKAVRCLETDIDELLNFYKHPEERRSKIRTTNAIERIFREVRRRIDTMGAFTNKESCARILYSVFRHLNSKWQERPLRAFNDFRME